MAQLLHSVLNRLCMFFSPRAQVTKPQEQASFILFELLLFFQFASALFVRISYSIDFCLTSKSICVRVNNTPCADVTPAVTGLFSFHASR